MQTTDHFPPTTTTTTTAAHATHHHGASSSGAANTQYMYSSIEDALGPSQQEDSLRSLLQRQSNDLRELQEFTSIERECFDRQLADLKVLYNTYKKRWSWKRLLFFDRYIDRY